MFISTRFFGNTKNLKDFRPQNSASSA